MIYGHIDRLDDLKAWMPALARAFDILKETDFSALENGTYGIDGKRMYYMIQERETKPESEVRAEAHAAYLDIHCVLSGEETIYVSAARDHAVVYKDELAEKDYILYGDKADEIACVLRPGNFAVLFPADAHRPWCAVDGRTATVRKVVFKIDTRQ